MPKLLIIAYYFAPQKEVGSFRATGFHRYLREFGWETKVITAAINPNEKDSSILRIPPKKRHSIKIPLSDLSLSWRKFIKPQLIEVLKDFRPNVVLITGGPFLYFELGLWIKKQLDIPYILDFRDPFTNPAYPRRILRDAIANFFERRWTSGADAVLIPTDAMRPYVKSSTTVYVIENGFDDIFVDGFHIQSMNTYTQLSAPISFVYAGKFIEGRQNPENFLNALQNCTKHNLPNSQFIHVGLPYEFHIQTTTTQCLTIDRQGLKSYEQTLDTIKKSDIGVIFSNNHAFEATTKIYDYIALGKPILAIGVAKNGGIHQILNRYGNYELCDNKEDAIAEGIRMLIRHNRAYTQISGEQIATFGRRYQTGQLAKILNSIHETHR